MYSSSDKITDGCCSQIYCSELPQKKKVKVIFILREPKHNLFRRVNFKNVFEYK